VDAGVDYGESAVRMLCFEVAQGWPRADPLGNRIQVASCALSDALLDAVCYRLMW
jgi:hypothetical protein